LISFDILTQTDFPSLIVFGFPFERKNKITKIIVKVIQHLKQKKNFYFKMNDKNETTIKEVTKICGICGDKALGMIFNLKMN
jgi:hypothetical protein